MIARAIEICDKYGWNKPICEQPEYNMLKRTRVEQDYRYLFEIYKYGTTIWSPLGQGILTGKYNDGNIPEGSRLSGSDGERMNERYFKNKEETIKVLKNLENFAKEQKVS